MELLNALRTAPRRSLRAVALLGFVAAGAATPSCDAIVDGGFRGRPIYSFEGQIVQFEAVGDAGLELRTTLLWLTELEPDPATRGPRLASAVEQRSAAVEVRFPAQFRVELFAPPDARMLLPGTGIGVALVVVYEDRDGDDRLTLGASPPELVGGAPYEVLVYARDAASAAAAPLGESIAPGFQLVRTPLLCAGADALALCTTPLGAPCASAADCGAQGACLTQTDGVVWPGGACAISADGPSCALSADPGLLASADGALWLIAGCEDEASCRDGYRCDVARGGCVPEALPDEAPAPTPRDLERPPCAIALGAPCSVDADCGEGQCLVRGYGETFRGGYCALALADADAAACEPAQGVPVAWDVLPDGRRTHWFRRCAGDGECRTGEGYACDPWWGACMPVSPVALELGPGYAPEAICYDLEEPEDR